MGVKTLLRSFAGGEISPEMFGRIDLDKFQTGLATCRNFITLPHGPARSRQGFRYILQAKYSDKKCALVEFSYSTAQTYTLEFGDQYVRFHTNGGTLLETAKTITAATKASACEITIAGHGFSNGNWVYISSVGGMTELNGRYYIVADVATDTFTLKDLNGVAINSTNYTTYTSGGSAGRVYEVATPYLEADVDDLHHVQSADVLTLVHPSYAPRELKRLSAANWTLTTISFVPNIAAPTSVSVAATVGSGSTTYTYIVTSVSTTELEESVASGSASVANNLATAGNKNTISWTGNADAIRYNVYKERNGLYGYIGQTDGTSFVDDNIAADVTRTPPEADNPFDASDKYPSAVSYFEQRRCFAGSNLLPQNLWMTRSGTESNMNYSIPTQDDDAITIRIAAREVNRIRHIVPLSDLILLTTSGEWRVWAQNSDAITPTTVSVRPQSYNGANNVQPVVTGNSVVYVRNQSSRLHELSYNWESNAYKSDDVSIMAPHLFEDYEITDMAITKTPVPIIWCVRSDGKLLGLTYMPNQKVFAWHIHDTDGEVESISAISENNVDVLYASIKRTNQLGDIRYIERLDIQGTTTLEDVFHVDSGLTYDDTETTIIKGLWHLEGKTVSILSDGAVHPNRIVFNGSITLQQAASKVHVGLPITADLQTLPISLEMEAFAQGRQKNVNKAWLRVYRSSGIKVGPSFDKLTEVKQRTTQPYGSPPELLSEEVSVMLTPTWSDGGQICVRQTDPLPLSILSMVIDVALGG